MRILITAGGTGGHIIPALTIADKLTANGYEIFWVGTKSGLEVKLVPNNIKMFYIPVTGLRGTNKKKLLLAPLKLLIALIKSILIIIKTKPNVVLGMGGFVSGPVGLAAWILRKPLVIHEQNSIAGTTNKILSKFSTRTLEAFPNSFSKKNSKNKKIILTGNPVRDKFYSMPKKWQSDSNLNSHSKKNPLRLLVIGGSRGAKALNECVPKMLANWQGADCPEVWHQTGEQHLDATKKLYENIKSVKALKSDHKVLSFIKDMPEVYAWADIVLARAGALTIAEITAIGIASILVPFPFAVDQHQFYNARYLEKNNATILIPQNKFSIHKLGLVLQNLSNDRQLLLDMAKQADKLSEPQALNKIVSCCQKLISIG